MKTVANNRKPNLPEAARRVSEALADAFGSARREEVPGATLVHAATPRDHHVLTVRLEYAAAPSDHTVLWTVWDPMLANTYRSAHVEALIANTLTWAGEPRC